MTKNFHTLTIEHKGKISDKWNLYLDIYERIFCSLRNKPISLLEIGIQNGGSLEIWASYFSLAKKNNRNLEQRITCKNHMNACTFPYLIYMYIK